MTKATHTLATRRALLQGATAVAILAPAATIGAAALASMPDPDARLIALIDKARAALVTYEAATAECNRTRALLETDPEHGGNWAEFCDKPEYAGLKAKTISRMWSARFERCSRRHGYDVAYRASGTAGRTSEALLLRVIRSRPKTPRGAMLQVAVILEAIMEEETDFGELYDVQDHMPVLVANMRELAT